MTGELHFVQPYWFFGLIIPLIWLIKYHKKPLHWPKIIQPLTLRYPALDVLHSSPDPVNKPPTSSNLWFVLLLILLIISLTQPVRFSHDLPAENEADAVDLILVVNTSVSMLLKDYVVDGQQIDRMEMTRQLLQQLVEKFSGKRIGLVILGRPASIWLPLTEDKQLVKHAIGRLRTTLGGRNSDIGETLELVRKQFKISPTEISSEKIVLLITDGYQQLGPVAPEIAVQNLLTDGFKLHTLAIGSSSEPEISLGKSHLIYAPADLQLMQHLAQLGQGEMVHALDHTVLQKLLRLLKKSPQETPRISRHKLIIDLYHYPLTLAMMILLYVLLPFPALASKGRRA